MKRADKILATVGFILLGTLLLFLCIGLHRTAVQNKERNVVSYGAVGDAAYHAQLGYKSDQVSSWEYQVGHYSRPPVMHTVYAKRLQMQPGDFSEADTKLVIEDSEEQDGKTIRISDITPETGYVPAVGDYVVSYEAADPEQCVPATDDSAAFEAAMEANDGRLYLPEGDYMISAVTASKIEGLSGPGRIWIKEWRGGTTYYLASGTSKLLEYSGYGRIDAEHWADENWRDMFWIGDYLSIYEWQKEEDIKQVFSSFAEYPFDASRNNINVWMTITPTVSREDFPDELTLCVSKESTSYYTVTGSRKWLPAAEGDQLNGAFYSRSWDGTNVEPGDRIQDMGDHLEIRVTAEDFFRETEDFPDYALHIWNENLKDLTGESVEYTCSEAIAWVKEEAGENLLMIDIGGDMRGDDWEGPDEDYIHEAYTTVPHYLTTEKQAHKAYSVPAEDYEMYFH